MLRCTLPPSDSPACCCLLPPTRQQNFWSRLAGRFGTKFYWQDKGQDVSIVNAVAGADADSCHRADSCCPVRCAHNNVVLPLACECSQLAHASPSRCTQPLHSLPPALPCPTAIDNCLREPIGRNQCSTIRGELE